MHGQNHIKCLCQCLRALSAMAVRNCKHTRSYNYFNVDSLEIQLWWGSLNREDRLEDIPVKIKFFFCARHEGIWEVEV
jgi:hypothetical protein